MKKIIIILTCVLLLHTNIYAQKKVKVPQKFLQSMQGDWKGKLTYTDYQDDLTQVTMDVWVQNTIVNKKLIKQFFYKEPDGNTKQKSKSQDTIYISKNGENWIESGYKMPFKIKEYTTKKSEQSSETIENGVKIKSSASASSEQSIVMETTEDDNNKKSTIRITITTTQNTMNIKKEVKYNGTDNFFVRSSFYYIK
ncbi:MAG: hypothetical protein EAZ44_02260 [Cytophagia bacterium]|nr:MAG: hypothetical protein EAY69_06460 [Cytophagales bacterium]TAG06502.1 MAG: hypothetical protein EAZ44_02260 [Cytophagia bacterium]TAG44272.1 MAG: hypothetical protein EAZ31_02690 [Cytophagia bacterium]TAH30946.1 MAG: hypothetical protein EAZ06_01160 [Cytophagales bacterium]